MLVCYDLYKSFSDYSGTLRGVIVVGELYQVGLKHFAVCSSFYRPSKS
jgi:hypothetical protein